MASRDSRQVIAGNLNTHSEAWGQDGNDSWGEEILTWVNEYNFNIVNDKREGPNFWIQVRSIYAWVMILIKGHFTKLAYVNDVKVINRIDTQSVSLQISEY